MFDFDVRRATKTSCPFRRPLLALCAASLCLLVNCGSDQDSAQNGAAGSRASAGSAGEVSKGSGGSGGSSPGTGGTSSTGGSSGGTNSGATGGNGGDGPGSGGSGAEAGGPADDGPKPTPPEKLDDWVRGHEGTAMTRHAHDNNVAVYVDDNVNTADIDWILPFASRAFQYMKNTYDPVVRYGPDHLYVFIHEDQFGGGTISSYFDDFSDFRNAVDNGSDSWARGTNIDIISHEMGHIVEGSSNGIHESPAFEVWKDSKWAEIFQYDLYVALGMTKDAERVFEKFTNTTDNFPRANTRWFRDWFYPLWRDHGKAKVLSNFFRLLAGNFPTRSENGGRNETFARRMNLGEFVHFYSGAAGKDLKTLGEKAFGSGFSTQLEQARKDFSKVTYRP